MTSRERVLAACAHQEPDRVPIHDSPWETTVARWRREGLPEGKSPGDYFGYEFAPLGADISLQLPEEVIEETDEYVVKRNSNGAIVRDWKSATSTPEMVDFTIKDRKKWEELKGRLEWNDSRVDWEKAREGLAWARKTGKFLCFHGVLGYDYCQGLVGSQRLLEAMVLDPDWVRDMMDRVADLLTRAASELISRGIKFDGAWVCDDMGYRNGLLFSPDHFRRLSKPAHKRLYGCFHDHGCPVILHSCGCVKDLVPDLVEIGLDCLQPLEVKAGMDLVELKKTYGEKLAFMGGIDVRKMSDPDPSIIEEEIRTKFEAAMPGGGYIYHSDHSVPDDVSFDQYRRVMGLVRSYGDYGRLS